MGGSKGVIANNISGEAQIGGGKHAHNSSG